MKTKPMSVQTHCNFIYENPRLVSSCVCVEGKISPRGCMLSRWLQGAYLQHSSSKDLRIAELLTNYVKSVLPCSRANESGFRALLANCNINCIAISQGTKAYSMLECFSDGALCPEKWLVLLHTHTIQFTSLQYTCGALRIPFSLYSRITRSYICYIYYIKLYIWLPKFYRTLPLLFSAAAG